MPRRRHAASTLAFALLVAAAPLGGPGVDPVMVAKIREEGLQRSQVMEYESYIADVLGARLTNSRDMQRAQAVGARRDDAAWGS